MDIVQEIPKRNISKYNSASTISIKSNLQDYADTIVGNCDSTLFLGGKEKTIVREFI